MAPIPLSRALRYLNPVLRNLFLVGVGFLITVVTIGWPYALVWFGITGIRHIIVDLVARRGSRVRDWSLREIDFRNIASSLFWTGVSVPVLAFVKAEFDFVWPFATTGHFYQFSRFFCISFINGLYLVMHNVVRGFEKGVIRANFFRNILSWPFASLFAPLGDLLFIPVIVQSKLWSDVVGGLIEGSGKFIRSVGLTRRDLSEIIPLTCEQEESVRYPAILDLLYIFGRETRSRNSMCEIFFGKRNFLERIGDALRGRTARPLRRDDEYRTLAAWFDHMGNYHKLADFVIERYTQEWTIMLIDLLEDQYLYFREWLAHQKPSALLAPAIQRLPEARRFFPWCSPKSRLPARCRPIHGWSFHLKDFFMTGTILLCLFRKGLRMGNARFERAAYGSGGESRRILL